MKRIINLFKNPSLLSLVLLCFVMLFGFNSDMIVDGSSYKDMVIPYFNTNLTYAFFSISIICILLTAVQKKIIVDRVSLLLLFRAMIYFIPVVYITGADFKIGIAYSMIQCVFAYTIGISNKANIKSVINILILFSIFISLEVFYVLVENNVSIFASNLKWYMTLPMGKHNYITCILVPIYILVEQYYKRNLVFSICYSILIGMTIVATGSRWGLLVFLISLVLLHFDFVRKKRLNKKTIFIALGSFVIFAGLVCINLNSISSFFGNVFLRYQGHLMLNRILVYKDCIALFFQHPFLGRSAYAYQAFDAVKAHNFILESFVQTGIIGSILFAMCLYCVYKRLKKIRDRDMKKGFLLFFFVVLFQGLFEPNLFGASSDFFFWLIISMGISFAKNLTLVRKGE